MKKRLWGFALFGLLGILSLIFDSQISLFFQNIRNPMLNYVFIGFTFEIATIMFLFAVTSLFLFKENKKEWILPLWVTAIIASIVSFIIKIIVQRPRPFETGIVSGLPLAVELLGKGINIFNFSFVWNFSFPSFQAALAFSALPLLDKEFKKLKYAWIIIALLIALSRVYFGVHYMSDVIFGGLIGYGVGLGVIKVKESLYNKKIRR
jgi:undecaprenyl-diphosphatase